MVATTPPAEPTTVSPPLGAVDRRDAAVALEAGAVVLEEGELEVVPVVWLAAVERPPPEPPQPATASTVTVTLVSEQMRLQAYIAHSNPRLGRGRRVRLAPFMSGSERPGSASRSSAARQQRALPGGSAVGVDGGHAR
jgi:hypothetical protein